ncbi:hypothetical protein MRB53_013779 [Persea americana]|uniref:Uncharacterized protein n=1 Tax=Persea americana TaxID=3435 RepID=A0ACC2K9K6_PERAE|nr:hypothetical protein MRB53_013779 [Persea americana]
MIGWIFWEEPACSGNSWTGSAFSIKEQGIWSIFLQKGANANLTVICPISPDDRCRDETLCTLRQRAKLILNKAVINEIAEDDVDDLSDQIRQLKGLIFSRPRHRLGIFALENPLLSLLKPPQNPYLLLLLLSHFFQAMDPTHLQQKLLPMERFNLQSFMEVLMGSLQRIWKRTDR